MVINTGRPAASLERFLGARSFRSLHPKPGHGQREAKVRGKTQKEESDVPRSFENPRQKL